MHKKKYLKESWISPKVEERNSPLHGRGLFAREQIKKDEKVVMWGGDFVNGVQAQEEKKSGKAIQRIDEDLWDVFDYDTRNEDPSYNHNHSCDPNTWMFDEVTIIARRDISKGEELTIDYALFVIDDAYVMQCACHSIECRKKITGKDWQKKDLQERYGAHFSPYLNKKIKELRWFNQWALLKPTIHFSEQGLFPKRREIWWARVGQNIGVEMNGKADAFERPVLILRVFNKDFVLVVPISSRIKGGRYYYAFKNLRGEENVVILSQIKSVSSKRLLRIIGEMPVDVFRTIIMKLKNML